MPSHRRPLRGRRPRRAEAEPGPLHRDGPGRGDRLRPDQRRRPDPDPARQGPPLRQGRAPLLEADAGDAHADRRLPGGGDATAWDTQILRAQAGLKNTGTGETFRVIECKNPPLQGRSGGGLFTDDFYVAGVCDFADPQHGNGLYAEPASIYRLLDRSKLMALYDPERRRGRDSSHARCSPTAAVAARRASTGASRRPTASIDDPAALDVRAPSRRSPPRASRGSRSGVIAEMRGTARAGRSWRAEPTTDRETEAVPAEMSRQNIDAPAGCPGRGGRQSRGPAGPLPGPEELAAEVLAAAEGCESAGWRDALTAGPSPLGGRLRHSASRSDSAGEAPVTSQGPLPARLSPRSR